MRASAAVSTAAPTLRRSAAGALGASGMTRAAPSGTASIAIRSASVTQASQQIDVATADLLVDLATEGDGDGDQQDEVEQDPLDHEGRPPGTEIASR